MKANAMIRMLLDGEYKLKGTFSIKFPRVL